MIDLLKLAKQVKSVQPDRPDNVFTTMEYAKAIGKARHPARKELGQLFDEGKVRPVTVKLPDLWGRRSNTAAWEIVNNDKPKLHK